LNNSFYEAAALIVPLVIAIVFHEVAHGWVASLLGDTTAKDLKRLSLNPIRHVDPFGTVILPGALALAGMPVFGWAKPVPVNKRRLRDPRTGMMIVAAAGPGMNLLLAAVGAVLLGLLVRPYVGVDQEPSQLVGFVAENLKNFLLINIFLALFNLLPIPPFDGSHIVEGVMPERLARRYDSFRKYGLLAVILILVVLPQVISGFDPVGYLVGPPVSWLSAHYLALTQWIAGV